MTGPFPQIPDHSIEGVLQAGPAGTFYRATSSAGGQQVTVQILPAEDFEEARAREACLQKLQAQVRLRHPNLLKVLAAGLVGECPYLVTETLQARNLRSLLDSGGPLPLARALELAAHVCGALETLHEAGQVHGDLHPGNVWLGSDGRVKVRGAGLARPLTLPSDPPRQAAGTAGYLAPEVLEGQPPAVSGDLYAVGALLYEVLSGRPLFLAGSEEEALQRQLEGKHTPLRDLSPVLTDEAEDLIESCLSPTPADRPPSAAALAAELEALAAIVGERVSEPADGQSDRSGRELAPIRAPAKAMAMRQSLLFYLSRGYLSRSERWLALGLGTACGVLFAVWIVWMLSRVAVRPAIILRKSSVETTARSALVRWETSEPCRSTVVLRTRELAQVEPVGNPGAEVEPTTRFEARFEALRPGTEYTARFSVAAEPDVAPDATSLLGVKTCQTKPGIEISNVRISVEPRSAMVSWETNFPTDTVVSYRKAGESFETTQSNFELVRATRHRLELAALEPGTDYRYRILAVEPDPGGDRTSTEESGFLTPLSRTSGSDLGSLAADYVRKLTRMTPDERARLRQSIQGAGLPGGLEIAPGAFSTPTTLDTLEDRLGLLERWSRDLPPGVLVHAVPEPSLRALRRLTMLNPALACKLVDWQSRNLHQASLLPRSEQLEATAGESAPASRAAPSLLDAGAPPLHPLAPSGGLPGSGQADLDAANLLLDQGRTAAMGGNLPLAEARLRQAYSGFKKLENQAPAQARVQYSLGLIHLLLFARLEQGLARLEKAESLTGQEPELAREVCTALAGICGLLDRSGDEVRWYEKALSYRPGDPELHFRASIAYDLARDARPDWSAKSFEHAKAAIKLDPAYKRKFKPMIRNSRVAGEVARIIREIIEKSEEAGLDDAEAEAYAARIGKILGDPGAMTATEPENGANTEEGPAATAEDLVGPPAEDAGEGPQDDFVDPLPDGR